MIKYYAFFTLLAFRLFYQPAPLAKEPTAFGNNLTSRLVARMPARLIHFNGTVNNNKVLLQWQVDENETAEQFEVQKSTDGKSFKMAALVFGTDKSETGKYWFYDKAGPRTFYYRIKMITKNQKTEYSPVISIPVNS